MKLLVVGDQPTFRIMLRYVVEDRHPGTVAVDVAGLAELRTAVQDAEWDLVLLDLSTPEASGFSALIYLCAERPQLPVVLVSANASPCLMRRAQQFGAAGLVSKSAFHTELDEALNAVLAGRRWFPAQKTASDEDNAGLALRRNRLTAQQLRVLLRLADGLSNKQIATDFSLSENTVKIHVSAILAKLGCSSRVQAVLLVRSPMSDAAEATVDVAVANGG